MFVNVTPNRLYNVISRYKSLTGALLFSMLLLLAGQGRAQSPTAPALNFNAFFLEDAEMSTSETEGPMAIGGDLKIKGNHDVAAHTAGTFEVGGLKIGLLVNGKVHYVSGNSFKVLNNGYVKIGNQNSSKVWYKDGNNAYSPIRITPGTDYNGSPRIELSASANTYSPEVSASNNHVFQGNLLDFGAAFNQMKQSATQMSGCTDNVHLTNANGDLIGRTNMPNQVKLTLQPGANILNISGTEINKIQDFVFINTPSASQYLIVNVDAPGTFDWNVYNSGGSFGGLIGCQYILYNFYNTTTLKIQGNGAVEGTVFAPYAHVTKVNHSNIEGQVIAKYYVQSGGGEIHYAVFQPDMPCGVSTPTDAKFTINDDKQCLDGNSFTFTSTSTGAAPLSYKWYFGDGNTAVTQNATHTYATAGTYSVKLVVTGAGGKDSTTKTVNVWPAPVTGFTVNNATQTLPGNSFVFTTSNHVSGNTYKWYFGDGNHSTSQDPTHSYAAAGTYTVKQVITSNKGCKDSTTLIVTVTETPTDASFTINNDKQCLDGNSFTFTSTSTGAAPLSYKWYFGDGNTAVTQNATHTYATAGTYSVKLVVTGAGGKDSVSQTVIVDAAQAGFTVNDTIQYLAGNSFQFTSTYPAHHYHWIFGDGNTSNAADPVHSYATAGTYQVKQIVYTQKGCMAYVYKTVQVLPEVTHTSFTINNDKQCLGGNSFSFTNTSTGAAPLTYAWSFGDGNTSTQASPVYSYAAVGNYTVQLVVTGAGGSDTATLPVTVYDAPVAGFTVNEATQELTGNSFVFTSTATGALTHHWNFGDQTTSADLNPVKSFDSAGTYEVTLIVAAASGCADTARQTVVVLSDSVTSGNDGGIESESMGGLVTKRDFNRIRNSVDAKVDYTKTAVFMPAVFNAVAKCTSSGQELEDMIPAQLEAGDAVYITSPTDLLSITSAVDVLSVDYTRDQKAKAVALGIKTLDRAYSHTKSICDRFRGAELLFVEDIKIQGYDFTRFALKRDGGIVEYAIAFVVGKDKRRDSYTLQTYWLLSSYESDENMYNFQVWSAHPDHAVKLAEDVLNNLKKEQPVQQINSLVLPKAYITYGMRDKENLIVRINNTTDAKSGRLVFEERINEDAGLTTLEIPLELVPGKDNVFVIPIKDGYEYQGSVYLDGVLEDEVYMADGNWGIDYDNSYTVIEQFERGNNKDRVYQDGEYPVYRNVTLQAKSRDYVSIYKAIRSGTEKADLTAYKSLKFYAQGSGEIEVRLTRDAIVDWSSQYKTVVSLTENGKEYTISFDDFLSDKIDAPFNPEDVKTIVFTYNTGGGKSQDITLHISDVSFSQEAVTATRGLDSRELTVAPNPNEGKFECRFVSDQERILDLSITDVTGKVVFSRSVEAAMGMNAIPVDLNLPSGAILFISLKGADDLFYDVQKMVIR